MGRPRKNTGEEGEAAAAGASPDDDRYQEPREAADPAYRDAGQAYVDEQEQDAD